MAVKLIRDLFSGRWTVVRAIFGARWKRAIAWSWSGVGIWDLTLSQFVPAEMAQRFPKIYQIAEMTNGFFSLSGWIIGVALLVVLFSFEYAYRHTQKLLASVPPTDGHPNPSEEQAKPSPILVERPAQPEPMSTGTTSLPPKNIATNLPADKSPPPQDIELISKTLPGWEKLYFVTQAGAISLHFMPDTKKPLADGLCLILLAHKLLHRKDKVSVSAIEDGLRQPMRNKPKSLLDTALGLQAIAIEFTTNLGVDAVDSGKTKRIELAKGGSYTFTWWGEAETLAPAQDMIRRA